MSISEDLQVFSPWKNVNSTPGGSPDLFMTFDCSVTDHPVMRRYWRGWQFLRRKESIDEPFGLNADPRVRPRLVQEMEDQPSDENGREHAADDADG